MSDLLVDTERSSSDNTRAPSFGTPGFGIYVHWPFCASKCPYCDFNSHVRAGGIDEPRFLAAYKREISQMAQQSSRGDARQIVSSIFFGGGTPSLMAPTTVAGILDEIAAHWIIADDAEITLEANPTSVEADRFKAYRTAGINRVSLGVQSLQDVDLKSLGRLHSADEARAAIAIAGKTFDRYSFDLIYARPKQTLNAWRRELDDALALSGGHLSLYQLTIEDGTPFAALHRTGKLKVPEGEQAHDLYELTQEMMEAQGLPAYEISNHAAVDQQSQHNLIYWRYGTYAGIGAGAHGRMMLNGVRTALSNECNPENWLTRVENEGTALTDQSALTAAEQADEMLLMGLRLSEGVDLARMARLTGLAPSEEALEKMAEMVLIEQVGRSDAGHGAHLTSRIRASKAGRFLLNQVVLRVSQSLEPLASETT